MQIEEEHHWDFVLALIDTSVVCPREEDTNSKYVGNTHQNVHNKWSYLKRCSFSFFL